MPIVTLFNAPCRAQVLLAAIGAQETLEHVGNTERAARAKLAGPSAVAAYERDRVSQAHRRNRAERALRTDEHTVWTRWRAASVHERAAIVAMLQDPPPRAARAARARRARP